MPKKKSSSVWEAALLKLRPPPPPTPHPPKTKPLTQSTSVAKRRRRPFRCRCLRSLVSKHAVICAPNLRRLWSHERYDI